MGVAVAGTAAGELALVVIPALEGTAQRGRDRAGPASHVEHVAVGAVEQHHQPCIAGDAARRLLAHVDAPCLFNDRLAGVGAGCRGRWAAAVRCRREVETDRGLDGRLARSGVRCRCRRFRGRRVDRARFRGSVCGGAGGLAAAEGLRFHVHRHLETVAGAAGIEPAGQRRSRPPVPTHPRVAARCPPRLSARSGAPAPVNDSLRLSWREIVPVPL